MKVMCISPLLSANEALLFCNYVDSFVQRMGVTVGISSYPVAGSCVPFGSRCERFSKKAVGDSSVAICHLQLRTKGRVDCRFYFVLLVASSKKACDETEPESFDLHCPSAKIFSLTGRPVRESLWNERRYRARRISRAPTTAIELHMSEKDATRES
jgi:hypothetical protein